MLQSRRLIIGRIDNGNEEGSCKKARKESSKKGNQEVTQQGKRRTGDASSVPRSAFAALFNSYGAAVGCGAFFGVARYPDTRFFSITFTTSSYSTGSLPV
jgi:hypothetical protein